MVVLFIQAEDDTISSSVQSRGESRLARTDLPHLIIELPKRHIPCYRSDITSPTRGPRI